MLNAAEPLGPDELARVAAVVDDWSATQEAENDVVAAVERVPAERLWLVRVHGEEKDVYTVRFRLRQRSLRYETFVMPYPEEDEARFHRYLLERNHELEGVVFTIGEEGGIFLEGLLPADRVTPEDLDRALGAVYAAVERCFRQALRIGYASRFASS